MNRGIVVLLLLLVFGCATHREFGKPIDQQKVAELVPGVTTKNDVRTIFGKPLSITENEKGETMWTYTYGTFDAHHVPLPFAKGNYKTSNKTTIIYFDASGKFQHSSYSRQGDTEETEQTQDMTKSK